METSQKNITNWKNAYYDVKKYFYFFIFLVFIIGNLIDIASPRSGFSEYLKIINTSYIALAIIAIILFSLNVISLYSAAALTLYALIINIFLSLIFNVSEPEFEIYYMREMMILGILLIPTGFILNKIHVLIFGSLIFVLYTGISFFTDSVFLRDNYVFLLIALVSYTISVYYIMLTLETWLNKQNNLIAKLEEKNKILDNKREELNKINKTKDRIFSIIAHDLKNPFNSIIGFSDLLMLKHKKLTQEKTEKYLKIINHSAIESEALLNNILNWATSQTNDLKFNPSHIKTDNLIDNVQVYFKTTCAVKEISFSIINQNTETIKADGNMLTTIIRNLIENAIKFTPQKGEVILIIAKKDGETLFEIKDTGVGISEENMNKLFESDAVVHTQGTNKELGTGLGLIICKDFVERHGGKIWVESEVNLGTSFFFTIPNLA